MNSWQAAYRPGSVLYLVAALSLIAGLIHLWVMPEHFEEWWGYGGFFLVAAAAQISYVPLLLLRPNRAVLVLGIVGNSAIILLYLLTRAVGVPLFGPEAGEVEGVGLIDVCATAAEVVIVIAIGAALLRSVIRQSTALMAPLLAGAVMLFAHLPHLVLLLLLLYSARKSLL
jgi:hypothetical protein